MGSTAGQRVDLVQQIRVGGQGRIVVDVKSTAMDVGKLADAAAAS